MRTPFFLRQVRLLSLAAGLLCLRAGAVDFDLVVTALPNPVAVSNALTYVVNVTNRTGLTVSNVIVTETFSAPVILIAATNSAGVVSNAPDAIVFLMDSMDTNGFATLSLVVQPTEVGTLTNVVTLMTTNIFRATNSVTNLVVSGIADLAVSLTGPEPGVLVNDWMTYTVGVTNLGPGTAPNVVLSNALPAAAKLILVTVTNPAISFTNNSLVFKLASLASGRSTNFTVTVQPTNAGTLTFSARVSAASLLDTNAANDSVSSNFTIGNFLSNQLVATLVSTQRYNPQTGLMEQNISLDNTGPADVASARVIVSGLTNWLFNAFGTNNSNPFVLYAGPLASGASINLLLEFFVPTRLPISLSNTQLTAVEVAPVSLPVPAGTPIAIPKIVKLSSGDILLEFPSGPGTNYTVIYCASPTFATNVIIVRPPIVGEANKEQWIDYGPPRTVSHPSQTTNRFYRVIQLP